MKNKFGIDTFLSIILFVVIIIEVHSGSFTDGTWLKCPQVRKHFTTEQIKAAASLQELLEKIKEW